MLLFHSGQKVWSCLTYEQYTVVSDDGIDYVSCEHPAGWHGPLKRSVLRVTPTKLTADYFEWAEDAYRHQR